MPSQTEITNKLTRDIISYVTLNRGFARRVNTQGMRNRRSSNVGAADIRIVLEGYSIDCEIKSATDKLNPDQEIFKQRVLNAKGQYWEVRTLQEFINLWERFKLIKLNQ